MSTQLRHSGGLVWTVGRFRLWVDPGPGAGGPGRLYKFDGTNWTLLKSYDPTQWTSFGLGGVSGLGLVRADMTETIRRYALSIAAWLLPLVLFFAVLWPLLGLVFLPLTIGLAPSAR